MDYVLKLHFRRVNFNGLNYISLNKYMIYSLKFSTTIIERSLHLLTFKT
jgi:hypothetical protein